MCVGSSSQITLFISAFFHNLIKFQNHRIPNRQLVDQARWCFSTLNTKLTIKFHFNRGVVIWTAPKKHREAPGVSPRGNVVFELSIPAV